MPLGVEGQPDLFCRLPERGVENVAIAWIPPSARKGHVARPGVTDPLGAPDEEDLRFPFAFTKYGGHCGEPLVAAERRGTVGAPRQRGADTTDVDRHGRAEFSTFRAGALGIASGPHE